MILISVLLIIIVTGALYLYLYQNQSKFIYKNKYDEEWDLTPKRITKSQIERQKITLSVLLMITLICSFLVRALAFGWAFLFLGILFVIAPLFMHFVIHTTVILHTKRSGTILFLLVLLSHILLFLFLLTQSDGFDGAGYSGLTILLSRINIELSHTDANKWGNFSYMLVIPLLVSWGLVQLPWLYEKMINPKENIR